MIFSAMVFGYDKGQLALISCGVRIKTPHEAKILGTDGMITVPQFWDGRTAILSTGDKEEVVTLECAGNGYECEAAEVARCVRAGKLESDLMPHEDTLANMQTLDAIREQWGLKYPMERE